MSETQESDRKVTKNDIVNSIIEVIKYLYVYNCKYHIIESNNQLIEKFEELDKVLTETNHIELSYYKQHYHLILYKLYKNRYMIKNGYPKDMLQKIDSDSYKNILTELDKFCRLLGYTLYYNTVSMLSPDASTNPLNIWTELCDI
jgi:hypothetical protein